MLGHVEGITDEPPSGFIVVVSEANWIPTAGKDFWLMCRFYGPDKPLFDGTWTLADVEPVH